MSLPSTTFNASEDISFIFSSNSCTLELNLWEWKCCFGKTQYNGNPRPFQRYLEIHWQCSENPRPITRYLEISNHCNASWDPVGSELKYDSKEVFGFFIAFVIWRKKSDSRFEEIWKKFFFTQTDIKSMLKLISQEAHISWRSFWGWWSWIITVASSPNWPDLAN